ncbi:MAG: amidohydrolase [SAR202 cluster bacterium]|nr:amidohydrolase [SAR202 cluster bacterium]
MASMREYIDSHVHVWTADTGRYPFIKGMDPATAVPRDFPPETLLRWARPSRVGRILIVGTNKYGTDNRYLFDTIERFPAVFRGAPILDHAAPDVAAQIKEALHRGAAGFRIVPQKDYAKGWDNPSAFAAMFTAAADTGQAVCLLISPQGLDDTAAMCARYPDTTVVIDHMARVGADGPVTDADTEALCRLAKYPNVFVKVSAFYALGAKSKPHDDLKPLIKSLVDAFGTSRLMWGSDAPHQLVHETYEDSIALVRDRLDFLSEAQRREVLCGTAERVFFWR